jgi:hypothetical protein
MHFIVGSYVTTPTNLHDAVSRAAKAKPRRQRTVPGAATFTAARAVVGALRGNYLYRQVGEGADEIVELAHGDTRLDRDGPGGESGQHSVPL